MYRLIFVDDEDMIRDFFEEIIDFPSYGFELTASFSSAEEALRYLSGHPEIDVVITDIKMGQMSGLDLCEEAQKLCPQLVFVLLTGHKNFDYAQRAIRQNVFDYLVKPTSFADLSSLLDRLKTHLNSRNSPSIHSHSTPPRYRDVVEVMRQLAQQKFMTNFSLENAARKLPMDAAYLSRLFKQQCGQTYSDYLVSLRIQRAKELLVDPTAKVYEIGYEVGYRNIQHFYKIFKQATGMTPTEYRAAHTDWKDNGGL